MVFDQRPLGSDVDIAELIDKLHRMRIAEGQYPYLHVFFPYIQIIDDLPRWCGKRDTRRFELRNAHIGGDPAVFVQRECHDTLAALQTDHPLIRQSPVMHETGEATHTVAALPDLAPIGIENPECEVHARFLACFQHQYLITAHAETAPSDPADLFRAQLERLSRGIEHDEVIAKPVHLGKRDGHRRNLPACWSQAKPRTGHCATPAPQVNVPQIST